MAKEYIEREIPLQQIRAEGQNLLEQEGRRTNEVLAYGHCFGIVDSVPAADVVEVVRCKGCKHLTPVEGGMPLCTLHNIGRVYSDFCSDGERKNDETD